MGGKPGEKPVSELDEEAKRDLEVFKFMEKNDPRYRGIAEKFERGITQWRSYQSQWEAQHPGEQFDPEDAQHNTVRERTLPKYDEADFDDARIEYKAELVADRRLKEAEQKRREQEEEREREAAKSNVQERIATSQNEALNQLISAADPEIAKSMTDPEWHKKLAEEDPAADIILRTNYATLTSWLPELEKLGDPKLKYKFDHNNPTHQALVEFAGRCEESMLNQPEEKQRRNGKMFATNQEWVDMPPAERAKHWTLQTDDIKRAAIGFYSNKAKAELEVIRSRYDRKGKAPAASAASQSTPPPAPAPALTPPPASVKPQSPTLGGGADVPNSKAVPNSERKTFADLVVNGLDL